MVEDVYPAVREADAIVMLCPNYNDALSANLTAFINRLTSLFRTTRFYDKALFAVVVSGYSGSDIVGGTAYRGVKYEQNLLSAGAVCDDGDGKQCRGSDAAAGD